MGGLIGRDIEVLKTYARSGNRELYWNYLAQKEGNDGYGLLALGVVRNDNLPGQVANAYARAEASSQRHRNPALQDRVLSEREWEAFGQTLLERDLELRSQWLKRGSPSLALNLPGRDVQRAHDLAFEEHGLDPNCWTPRILLEAARKKLGDDTAEAIWKDMLDNGWGGISRAGRTAGHAFSAMPVPEASAYVAKLGAYELGMLSQALPASNPNIIGTKSLFHVYNEKAGTWHRFTERGLPMQERNPQLLESLNDAREVRLERAHKATQFHPDDPYRQRIETPKVVFNDMPGDEQQPRLARLQPGDEHYSLYQQIREHMVALDVRSGRDPDGSSERLAFSLTALAAEQGLQRADHVVLGQATPDSVAGSTIFVVQGGLHDPARLRAGMATDLAVQTPVEQSLLRLEAASREQHAHAFQAEQLAQHDQQQREARSLQLG